MQDSGESPQGHKTQCGSLYKKPKQNWFIQLPLAFIQACSVKTTSQMICPLPVIHLPPEFRNKETNNTTSRKRRQVGSPDVNRYLDRSDTHARYDLDIPRRRHRRNGPTAVLNSSDPSVRLKMFIGFELDNYPKYLNISKPRSDIQLKLRMNLPQFFSDKVIHEYDPTSGETLKIKVLPSNIILVEQHD